MTLTITSCIVFINGKDEHSKFFSLIRGNELGERKKEDNLFSPEADLFFLYKSLNPSFIHVSNVINQNKITELREELRGQPKSTRLLEFLSDAT